MWHGDAANCRRAWSDVILISFSVQSADLCLSVERRREVNDVVVTVNYRRLQSWLTSSVITSRSRLTVQTRHGVINGLVTLCSRVARRLAGQEVFLLSDISRHHHHDNFFFVENEMQCTARCHLQKFTLLFSPCDANAAILFAVDVTRMSNWTIVLQLLQL